VKPLLVRDLALERWASMDRYALALAQRIPGAEVAHGWEMQGPRYLTRYYRYPKELRGQAGDVVHVLDHSYAHCLREFGGMPSVVTVHDLYPLRVLAESKRTFKGVVRDTLLRWVLRWLDTADRLIVSTQFTSREAQHFLKIPAERICVIPYGVDPHFFVRPSEDAIQWRRKGWLDRREGAPPKFVVLHVGSCAPRKNIEAAITALGTLREGGLDAIFLQLGGTFGPSHLAAIAAAGVTGQVFQESSVTEADLVSAYHAADVLVMPSSFEGFGLPVVEAQAAGLPVVTSGAGGLREAAGDASIVTGTTGAGPLAETLGDLLLQPDRRADLSARGRARAATMTWDRTAELTAAVYAELVRR
jgi:glycosyltransferase involved in cell wall biosynthesis